MQSGFQSISKMVRLSVPLIRKQLTRLPLRILPLMLPFQMDLNGIRTHTTTFWERVATKTVTQSLIPRITSHSERAMVKIPILKPKQNAKPVHMSVNSCWKPRDSSLPRMTNHLKRLFVRGHTNVGQPPLLLTSVRRRQPQPLLPKSCRLLLLWQIQNQNG